MYRKTVKRAAATVRYVRCGWMDFLVVQELIAIDMHNCGDRLKSKTNIDSFFNDAIERC